MKYRNKAPSTGNLYVTDDNRSFRYKFTQKNDLDKVDDYIKSVLHVLTNKPIEKSNNTLEGNLFLINLVKTKELKDSKKKAKKTTKKH